MAGTNGSALTIKDFEDMMSALELNDKRKGKSWEMITGEGGIKLMAEKHPEEFILMYKAGMIKVLNEESQVLLDQLYEETALKIKNEQSST